ncbi:cell division protein FtsN [Mannheimia granulomatis]|nr:cell division protein FtsN [Mannheimia granulomatis]
MPQRDYIARSNEKKSKKTKKESNVKKILMLIIGLILLCGIGLWFLKANAPTPTLPATTTQPNTQQSKSELPSRPEETWTYIRDLETRTVITDNSQTSQERLAQLTSQQKQQIEERRQQEEARLAQQAQTTEAASTNVTNGTETVPTTEALTEEELAAKKAEQELLAQKQAEEKRKQAELKKQQEAKKAEQAKLAEEKAKQQPAKIVAAAATPADKAANQAGKFGLQCGAFKNKAQAENMQARLAMAGFHARIATSADWNRVFVGPVGDRAATSRAQSNARSVAECVIVAM